MKINQIRFRKKFISFRKKFTSFRKTFTSFRKKNYEFQKKIYKFYKKNFQATVHYPYFSPLFFHFYDIYVYFLFFWYTLKKKKILNNIFM